MIKKIISLLIILITFLFCQDGITLDFCNLRVNPNPRSKIIKVLPKGLDLKITGKYGAWVTIKIIKDSNLAGNGEEYLTYIKNITNIDGKDIIAGQGAILRSEGKDSVGAVRGGAEIEIIKKHITWFKVECLGTNGWGYSKLINIK